MWDGWNPVQDIKDEWARTKCIWGKVKVFLFFLYVWFLILGMIYMFFVPSMHGWDCLAAGEESVAIRLFSFYVIAFLLFIVRDGTKLSNVRFFAALWILFYATIYWFRDALDSDCFDALFGWIVWDLGTVIVIVICAYVERRVDGCDGGSTGETSSLVV